MWTPRDSPPVVDGPVGCPKARTQRSTNCEFLVSCDSDEPLPAALSPDG